MRKLVNSLDNNDKFIEKKSFANQDFSQENDKKQMQTIDYSKTNI